jgi:hypothetical protein
VTAAGGKTQARKKEKPESRHRQTQPLDEEARIRLLKEQAAGLRKESAERKE